MDRFFFFKQKTAYEMRISDWSSGVCSSDLRGRRRPAASDDQHRGRGVWRRTRYRGIAAPRRSGALCGEARGPEPAAHGGLRGRIWEYPLWGGELSFLPTGGGGSCEAWWRGT